MSCQEEAAGIIFTRREVGQPTTYPEIIQDHDNVIYLFDNEEDVEDDEH